VCEKDKEPCSFLYSGYVMSSSHCIVCQKTCIDTELCECGMDHMFDTKEEFPCSVCGGERVVTVLCKYFRGRA
jgi:hypothetical protein